MTDQLIVKVLGHKSTELSFFGAINNTWFYCAIVVCRNSTIIAGLCVYNNTYVKRDGNNTVLIGNVKCEDNAEIFAMLLNEAEIIAKQLGAECVIGPIDGSTWDAYRFSLKKQGAAFSGDITQDLYYNSLMLQQGYSVLHRYYSSVSSIQHIYNEESLPLGITVRNISIEQFEEDLRALHPMCVSAFADNELFSPIDEEGFVKKYIAYKAYVDPKFVLMAEDAQGVVALFFCYKGLYGDKFAIVIKTIARHPQRRYKGLIEIMAKIVYNKAYAEGIKHVVHAFMHEQNKSLKLSAEYGGNRINEYAVYIKYLHD